MKYEFHVGDYVETTGGREGYILKYSCFPDEFLATWYLTIYYKEYGCSTVYEVRENCFPVFFKRIGQYDFTKKDEGKIEPLIGKQANDYCNNELMWNKINELIEAVNELRDKND